ncbi:MAG: OPT/YSL family transporter [Opitutales bacterium]|nr:OPT/YSL family transporter [Opitutales bacterium]
MAEEKIERTDGRGHPLDEEGIPLPTDNSLFAMDNIPADLRDAYWRKYVYRADKEPQLTVRGAIFGGLIGILACASSMYTSLKIGWGFGIALVAVILSFVVFNALRSLSRGRIKPMGVLENAATSSVASVIGMTTTHTVVSAFGALMLLNLAHDPSYVTEWYKMVPMIFFAALTGTCIAIPLKRSLINQERLRFPSSIASAETLRSLYASDGSETTKRKVNTLLSALGFGAALGLIKQAGTLGGAFVEIGKEKVGAFFNKLAFLPDEIGLPDFLNPLKIWGITNSETAAVLKTDKGEAVNIPEKATLPGLSFDISVLMVGAGMLCGMRVCLTMLGAACLLDWVIAPWLIQMDILHVASNADIFRNIEVTLKPDGSFGGFKVVYWSLWCGTAIMVMASFTSLAFQWKTIYRAFSGVFSKNKGSEPATAKDPVADCEVPMKWFFIGIIPAAIGLICTLHFAFNTQWYLGVLAIFLAGAFGLICARSCGEADTNPIGAMGKISQLIYSVMPGARGNVDTNLITGGVTAAAGGSAGDLMSDMKLGNLLGMKPRIQFFTQLLAICIGTVIVVPVWRLLVPSAAALEQYPAPPARMWKAVAEFLNDASVSLPTTVYWAMAIGGMIGVALPCLEKLLPKYRAYLPSAIGLGIVLTLPGAFNNAASFALGAIIVWLWHKFHAKTENEYSVALASGFVGGESIACAVVAMTATAILQFGDKPAENEVENVVPAETAPIIEVITPEASQPETQPEIVVF